MEDLTTPEAPVMDAAPPPRVRHRRRVWLAVAAMTAVAAVVVVGRPSSAPPAAAPTAPPVRASVLTAPPSADAAVRDAVLALLRTRAAAVLAVDPRAFRATDAATPERRFDPRRLGALPIRAWAYDVDAVTATGEGRYAVTAALRYQLAGDAHQLQVPLSLQVLERDGQWRVAVEESTGERRLPWELGAVRVARGTHSLVIGVGDSSAGELRQWAADADAAVRAIRAVVPSGWTPQVTVVVPGTTAAVAALSGRDRAGVAGFAGFAVAEPTVPGGPGEPGDPAYRIYLNTPLLAGAPGTARIILLRHEITHVALGAPATDATPLWLEEGVAEYLGYRGSGVATAVAVRDLVTAVRAGYRPRALPTDAQLRGPRAMVGYEAAHLLCQVMVDRVGLAGLLRTYRITARSGDFAAAWREVAGQRVDGLAAAWQARVRAVAG